MAEILHAWRPAFDLLMGATCLMYVAGVLWFRRGIASPLPVDATLATTAPPPPFVSVVVAARDEERHLASMLDGLEQQTYPHDRYEIIIVDDGSLDRTPALVRERQESLNHQFQCAVRLIQVPAVAPRIAERRQRGSKKVALQHGIDAAQGDIILSTDADCRLPPEWVAAMAKEFAPGVGMVVGFSRIGNGRQKLGLRGGWEAVDFYNLMLGAVGSAGRGHAMAASGQNLGFRRQAFVDVGGYESVLHRVSGDDVLLLQLIRRSGDWQIRFCREATAAVHHPPSSSWRSLLSQRVRWASNAPCQMRLDPVFFGYLSATFTFGLLQVLSPLLWLGGGLSAHLLVLAIVCKVASEWSLFTRGLRLFPATDLPRFYPLWTCLHPLYLVCIGITGCLGRFSWKDGSFWWGGGRPRSGSQQDGVVDGLLGQRWDDLDAVIPEHDESLRR